MKKVLVLMSTYNGECYLRDQLSSLYRQECVDVHLLVRDDGSSDGTISILNEFSDKYGKMTILMGENMGPAKSFHYLIYLAHLEYKGYDYYAFCDQDDVWKSDKIKNAVALLEGESAILKLYYSRTTLTDALLNPIECHSVNEIVNSLYANVISNHSPGCTQVFNYNLLCKVAFLSTDIQKNTSSFIPMHDCWVAVVAYACGSKVIVDNSSYILYRQHGKNSVGGLANSCSNRIRRILDEKYCAFRVNLCSIVLKYFGSEIPEENLEFLKKVVEYKNSWFSTFKLLITKKVYAYSWKMSVPLFFMILFRRF